MKRLAYIVFVVCVATPMLAQYVASVGNSGAGAGPAVWTLAQSNSSTTGGVSTQAVTIGSSVAAGDLLIMNGQWGTTTGSYSVTDGASGCTNTWTAFTHSPATNGSGNSSWAFWTINGCTQAGGITATVSITGASTHTIRAALLEYHSTTGIPASPVDQGASANSGSVVTAGNAGNITPLVTNTLVFSVIELDTSTATSMAVSSPCTIRNAGGTSGNGYVSAGRVVGADVLGATTSAQTCPFTWVTGNAYSSIIQNFKPN